MYDVVLLDLDHTIFDFAASEVAAFADSMEAAGIAHDDGLLPRFQRFNDAVWKAVERRELTPTEAGRQRFELFLADLGLDGRVDPGLLSETFQRGLGAHGELYGGVVDLLEDLASRVPLGLVTNGISGVQRAKIDRLDLERFFGAIVISDEVGLAKPDPGIFDLALTRLAATADDTVVMVGDSLSSDMAGARAAGIASCWFDPDRTEPRPDVDLDHVIHDLAELLEVLGPPSGKKETGAP